MPPRVTPSLRFRWSDFVYGVFGECLPACVLMANKYWAHFEPDLEVLSSIEEVKSKMEGIFYTKKGPSLEQLKKSCGVKRIQDIDGERWEIGITLEMRCPENLEVLYPFFESDPPIPLILLYDHRFMETNLEGDLHAVLIDGINYEKEKIFVIDPIKKDLKEPFPYDFSRFRLAWQKSQHTTLLAYPLSKLQVIEGKEVKMWKQTTLGV